MRIETKYFPNYKECLEIRNLVYRSFSKYNLYMRFKVFYSFSLLGIACSRLLGNKYFLVYESYGSFKQLIGVGMTRLFSLRMLCIEPEFHGAGIGNALLNEIENDLHKSYGFVFLKCLKENNKFYSKNGYTIVSSIGRYYGYKRLKC